MKEFFINFLTNHRHKITKNVIEWRCCLNFYFLGACFTLITTASFIAESAL